MGTFVDVLLCAVLVFFAISGFRRGFVRSFAEFAGCIAAMAAAIIYSPQVVLWLKPYLAKSGSSWLQNPFMQRIIVGVLLYAVLEALVQGAALLLDRLFHLPVLKQINSLLGGVFGLFKGTIVVLLVCAVMRLSLPANGNLSKPAAPLQQLSVSHVYQITSAGNPIYTLFQTNHWNEVGRNGK